MRASTEEQRAALKAATGRSIRAAGGASSLALDTRVNVPVLSKYAAPEGADDDRKDAKYIPVDVALDADLVAGSPIITTAMATALGYRLVRNDDSVSASAVEASDLVAMIGQFTRLTGAFADAAADGRVDAGERRQILTLIDQNMAALNSLAHRFGGA